jgi:tRNA pseudouridine55 synthase
VNLVINLNKPKGLTSNDALQRVKRLFKVRKAGHAGTLDPLAEGVLVIGLNEATKILPYLTGLDKEYVFTSRFGIITDTYDAEGNIVDKRDIKGISQEAIEEIIPRFTGKIAQRAPIYSALKHKGKPLYDYARAGIGIEPPVRVIEITELRLIDVNPPIATFKVKCSSGTYIRSLCHDIGLALGSGAHITVLKRTRIGHFSIDEAVSIDELPNTKRGIMTIDSALQHLPELHIPQGLIDYLKQGRAIKTSERTPAQDVHDPSMLVRLLDPQGTVFAIGHVSGGVVRVKRVLKG